MESATKDKAKCCNAQSESGEQSIALKRKPESVKRRALLPVQAVDEMVFTSEVLVQEIRQRVVAVPAYARAHPSQNGRTNGEVMHAPKLKPRRVKQRCSRGTQGCQI